MDLWWLSATNASPCLCWECRGGREGERAGREARSPLSVLSHLNNVGSPLPPHHHLWTFSHGSAAGKSDNWLDCCTVRETLFFSYLIRDTHTAALKFQYVLWFKPLWHLQICYWLNTFYFTPRDVDCIYIWFAWLIWHWSETLIWKERSSMLTMFSSV